jgi:DNA-binding protein HU-beta
MTKADIVDIISKNTGITKLDTETVVNQMLDTIKESLKSGKSIEIRGFGSFKVVKRAARKARNPTTNEEVLVPERHMPSLKFSKEVKSAVNDAQS